MNKSPTPLLEWLRAASKDQRERLARLCDTSVNYLYLLATCERDNPGAAKALAIEDATRLMHEETGGVLPIVTVRTLVTMCVMKGLHDATAAAQEASTGDKV